MSSLQCSDRLDPVQIKALLGIQMGITCLLFPLVGCVLGCQQLRWWCWWREGWEPWPRADLSEHPVPEGDNVQHPLPAVADEAEAEGAQVKVPAQRFSGSLTVTVLPASGVFQHKMEGFEHRNDLELLGKWSTRMLWRQQPLGGQSVSEAVSSAWLLFPLQNHSTKENKKPYFGYWLLKETVSYSVL